ncbi:MAG: AbrB/MazE/SpoVT family DNA-binding domain-containing protein [Betaproteobacteria bacterium]|nr:AbrB/MazE/SpoVT family DNA-binding domain-containing protein [Betaproteobacteria bacterium]
MELAKITTRGQITIPLEIRRKLGVKDGDKVVFLEKDGRIIIENSVMLALKDAQDAFRGEAERQGLKTEQDVAAMVKDIRRERGRARNA